MSFKERFQPALLKAKNHIIQNKDKYGLVAGSLLGAAGGAIGSQLAGVDDDYRQEAIQNMNSDIDNAYKTGARDLFNATGMKDYINAVQNKYNAGWFDRAFNIDDLDAKVHDISAAHQPKNGVFRYGDPDFHKTSVEKDIVDKAVSPIKNFFGGAKETAHKIDSGLSRSLSILKDKAFGEYDPKNYPKPEVEPKLDNLTGPTRDNIIYLDKNTPVEFDKHDPDVAQGQVRKALTDTIKSKKNWSNSVLSDWLDKGGTEKIRGHLNDYNSADFRASRNYGALGGLAGAGLFKAAQSKYKKKPEGQNAG